MTQIASNRPDLPPEIGRRRTFAIISHPDAGKTTLTEKFLLFGGAIQMAGQVRAKGEARRTRSDFMQMEKDRGISVSASAMSFEYHDFRFNLVDTPGHSDYRHGTHTAGTLGCEPVDWNRSNAPGEGVSLAHGARLVVADIVADIAALRCCFRLLPPL